MTDELERFRYAKKRAHDLYTAQSSIRCPYFQTQVVLNSDGFHHLQFSAAYSGDLERPIRSIMNTDSGDHERRLARA